MSDKKAELELRKEAVLGELAGEQSVERHDLWPGGVPDWWVSDFWIDTVLN